MSNTIDNFWDSRQPEGKKLAAEMTGYAKEEGAARQTSRALNGSIGWRPGALQLRLLPCEPTIITTLPHPNPPEQTSFNTANRILQVSDIRCK